MTRVEQTIAILAQRIPRNRPDFAERLFGAGEAHRTGEISHYVRAAAAAEGRKLKIGADADGLVTFCF